MTENFIVEPTDVLIEIPFGSNMKYELDKETGFLRCDRQLYTAHSYPFNYGFFPNTLSGDGDELDAVVVVKYPIIPLSLIKCKIIGVLLTTDEKGPDEKIICVPHEKVDPDFEGINNLTDLHQHELDKIHDFFTNYKSKEPNKFCKVNDFKDANEAKKIYLDGKKIYNNTNI